MTSNPLNCNINKYILCVPRGGFNDILNQINVCYQYAIKHDRVLLIDCSKNYIFDFSIFFTLTDSNIIYDNATISNILESIRTEKKSIYPQVLEDVILDYQSEYKDGCMRYRDIALCTLRNPKNIKQINNYDLIVHDSSGGGENISEIIDILQIKEGILILIKEYLDRIEKPYLSIHVRNTDIKTDYVNLFKKNKDIIDKYKNIFLSTDSIEVLNFFSNRYNHKNVFSFTKLREDNSPLHNRINKKTPLFFDALRDLVLLIYGDDLIVELEQYCGGFTKLIHRFHKSSQKKTFKIE